MFQDPFEINLDKPAFVTKESGYLHFQGKPKFKSRYKDELPREVKPIRITKQDRKSYAEHQREVDRTLKTHKLMSCSSEFVGFTDYPRTMRNWSA